MEQKTALDNPGEPEEPSPGWAQGANTASARKPNRNGRAKIRVVGGLAEFDRAFHEIDEEAAAKRRRKENEQPGCDCAPACELGRHRPGEERL